MAEESPAGEMRVRLEGRRRRANADEPRDVEQKVRLTRDEMEQLRARADAVGVTVPRLLVEAAFAQGSETVTERRQLSYELRVLYDELSRIGVNMNQIAKKANTTHELPSDFAVEYERFRELAFRIERVVDGYISAQQRERWLPKDVAE